MTSANGRFGGLPLPLFSFSIRVTRSGSITRKGLLKETNNSIGKML